MKIVLIGPAYPFRGGISHYTTLLFRHLKIRHKVRFFSFSRQYPQLLFPGKSDIDHSLTTLQEPGVERILDSMNPITWFHIAKEIIRTKCDVVIIPWWVSFWAPQFLSISLIVKRFTQAKILFVCHNVLAHESRWIDQVLTRSVLKQGDLFIVHSEEDRQNLMRMLPDTPVRKCFHPTYDIFYSHSDGVENRDIRVNYGLDGPVLLFFGFVRKYKGLEFLLKAMPKILEAVPATLIVAGEFWNDKTDYEVLINNLGIARQVILLDNYIPNEAVGAFFAAADLVVQPYISATGSGVVQMAFGFNKPVVATTVGSLPEIVEDGRTGFLVPPGDAMAIAEAVIRFFDDAGQPDAFARNIRDQQYRFSWDHLVDAIEEMAE